MTPYHDVLVDAIKNRLQVTFRYRSNDEEEVTVRVVDPAIYGVRNGKACLYGYQISGGSSPGHRRFNLEKVKHVSLTGEHIENHNEVAADVTKWEEIHAEGEVRKAA